MNDYQDFELIDMVSENHEEATDILYEKYNYIVEVLLSKYKRSAMHLGVDLNEFRQEAMVGFSDALVNYNQEANASLSTFISLCVKRRLRNYLRKASTQKNKMLQEMYSLDYESTEEVSLRDFIGDNRKDPQVTLEDNENVAALKEKINEVLSPFEKEVYALMINGFTYDEISSILNINQKKVYNTIARIRSKIKEIL